MSDPLVAETTGPHRPLRHDGVREAVHDTVHDRVEEVARTSYGRLLAYLAAQDRDIAAAEDALSEAFVAALRSWPVAGVPDRPDSWLLTAARRTLIDGARRRDTARRRMPDLARLAAERSEPGRASTIPDVRLQLMFACTHPAVAEAARCPLMLQTVLGLDAARIATVFVVPPATMGQRLVRAKAKIRAAGVPFTVPDAAVLDERVGAVLDAIYAAYTAGWDAHPATPDGADGPDHSDVLDRADVLDDVGTRAAPDDDLTVEALRLARIVVQLLPQDPEATGLLALLLHSHARRAARRDRDGRFVPLQQQDVSLWSRALVTEAEQHLARAAGLARLGPYQLMAAVQSVHNLRAVTGRTDHHAVAQLYEGLAHLSPTLGVLVARAAAVLADGRAPDALRLLDDLDGAEGGHVSSYQPYWVTRAAVCTALGDDTSAHRARTEALRLTRDDAVRTWVASPG